MQIKSPGDNLIEISIYLSLLIILILLSALVSGAEIAFFSLDKKLLEEQKKKNPLQVATLSPILKSKNEVLSTLLISNNFLNIGIILISSFLTSKYLNFGEIILFGKTFSFEFLIEIIGITTCILLFGEIIPKIYARKNNFRFALLMAKPILILNKILKPFNYFIIKIYKFLDKKITKKSPLFSKEQLLEAIHITNNGKPNKKEDVFLQGIVQFGNIETKQVMSPRVDIFSLKYDTPYLEVLKSVLSEGYSRIPVYKESIDDIEGILYVKDFLAYLDKKNDFQWTTLLHPALFVPENKKISDLLSDFKSKRIHLAIVVDEYGGTSGLVTLEDVIEEIVGDISDEFDEKTNLMFSKIDQNRYLFEGKTPLIDFYKHMQIEEEEAFEQNKGDADTLAGFIIEINKGFPNLRQKVNFLNYTFVIQGVNEKRIHRIEVQRKKKNTVVESL